MTPQTITKAARSTYQRSLASLTLRWPIEEAQKRAREDAIDVAHYLAAEAELPGAFDAEKLEWRS